MAGFFELTLKAGLSCALAVALMCTLTQMVTSLVAFAGVLINSDQAFHVAEDCVDISAAIFLCLCAPLVLVTFALLAVLMAVCGEDRGMLYFSVACQATASILTLIGLTLFVVVYWSYVVPAFMTVWYYTCVAVLAELAVTALLTGVSARWQAADRK